MSAVGDLWVSERARPATPEDAAGATSRLRNCDPKGFNSFDIARTMDSGPVLAIVVHGPWCAIQGHVASWERTMAIGTISVNPLSAADSKPCRR